MKDYFISLCRENIKRDGLEELLTWLEVSDFYTAPASSKFHGNYEGGLLEHSLNVYKTLTAIADTYSDKYPISQESITIVALFHDLCKVNFYKKGSRNVKDLETGRWFAKDVWEIDERLPLGHGEKSCIILQWFLSRLETHELMAIRWHMGGFDSASRGGDYSLNKAFEICQLAVMLHIADCESSYLLERKEE